MQFRVSEIKNSKYAYSLSDSDAHIVRTVGLISIFLIVNLAVGFYLFASQSLLLTLLFAPTFLIVLLYNFLDAFILTQFRGFSIPKHLVKVKQFMDIGIYPKVIVAITAAGEEVSIVERTLSAATKIDYPNYDVYLLDDSKDALYRELASKHPVHYFRRAKVGLHKKAGNLNSLLKNIKHKGYQHILVLDADFVPHKDMVKQLMPYTDVSVGIVQSPQHFGLNRDIYKRSKFEYGAALIQRDFYRITQVARNQMGGAICVGTNALYNLAALEKVGGYEGVGSQDWGHSEDVNTGLKMINTTNKYGQRYRIDYLPVQLATGTCPDDHLSFYKQQNRWATGSMQLMFSRKTLFSKQLSMKQKLCYLSNSTYYFYTISLLLSPLTLLALLLIDRSFDWQSTLLFIPTLLVSSLIGPVALRRHIRPIASSIVVISNAYTFTQALFLLLIRRPLGWEATGTKSTKKTRQSHHFMLFKIFSSGFFIFIYLLVLATLFLNQRFNLTPSITIVILFIIAFISHIVYLHHMLTSTITMKRIHKDIHTYVYIFMAIMTTFVIGVSVHFADRYDMRLSNKTILKFEEAEK